MEDNSKKTKQVRFSLRLKMNILIAVSILITALGLTLISYTFHCQKINSIYLNQAEQAAYIGVENALPENILLFIENIETDEFRTVREKAVAANDPGIIEEWMKTKKGTLTHLSSDYTLYDDYEFSRDTLLFAQEAFPLAEMYFVYDKGDATYNGDELYANIKGQMNSQTSPQVERQLLPALEGAGKATLDLAGLDYISSAGLSVLLTVMHYTEEHGCKLIIKNVSPEIMSVFDLTGFTGDLNIE